MAPELMIVTETLALPWLDEAGRTAGFAVLRCRSVRAAIARCRERAPAAVLAEFRYNPTYSSHSSSLESLIAGLQRYAPRAGLAVLYERERAAQLGQLAARHPIALRLAQPVQAEELVAGLRELRHRVGAAGS